MMVNPGIGSGSAQIAQVKHVRAQAAALSGAVQGSNGEAAQGKIPKMRKVGSSIHGPTGSHGNCSPDGGAPPAGGGDRGGGDGDGGGGDGGGGDGDGTTAGGGGDAWPCQCKTRFFL